MKAYDACSRFDEVELVLLAGADRYHPSEDLDATSKAVLEQGLETLG